MLVPAGHTPSIFDNTCLKNLVSRPQPQVRVLFQAQNLDVPQAARGSGCRRGDKCRNCVLERYVNTNDMGRKMDGKGEECSRATGWGG